jgi:hypothetical protein
VSNVNAPRGFKPVRHLTGGQIRLSEYSIASTYGYNIGRGHPVELTGTGTNIQLSAAQNPNTIGVFAGCRYVDAAGKQHFSNMWPASMTATNIVALVWDDPNIVYEVQGDSVAEGDIGTLVDLNAGTTDTVNGLSGAYAVVSGATGTTDKTLQILRLVNRPDNAYGAYAKIEVIFQEQALRGVVAGVGGV